MIKFVLVFICLISFCAGQKSIAFRSCSDNTISQVTVDPCDSEPCSFARGTKPALKVFTTSNQDSESLKLSVKANIAGQDIKFPGLKEDACRGNGITCPIKKGDDVQFKFEVKVLDFYPKIDTDVTIQVQGSSGPLFCFVVPIKIV